MATTKFHLLENMGPGPGSKWGQQRVGTARIAWCPRHAASVFQRLHALIVIGMLYAYDSWTYNRQMYKRYEGISDFEWLTGFTLTFYQLLTGYNAQQTWPVFRSPIPPPPKPFFPYCLCARYVRFSSFRFWFRFGSTFFLFFFFSLHPKIVKLYKKLVSIVFIDRASKLWPDPARPSHRPTAARTNWLSICQGLRFIGHVCVCVCMCLVACGMKTSSIL